MCEIMCILALDGSPSSVCNSVNIMFLNYKISEKDIFFQQTHWLLNKIIANWSN